MLLKMVSISRPLHRSGTVPPGYLDPFFLSLMFEKCRTSKHKGGHHDRITFPPSDITNAVREHYGRIARSGSRTSGCNCCAPTHAADAVSPCENLGEILGYGCEDLEAIPEGANLGLGCGNPLTLAALQSGETVLDLGNGAGFDCFLAARRVGADGLVIGVDMTPEMVAKARENAHQAEVANAIIGQFVKDQPAAKMRALADELLGTHLSQGRSSENGCPLEDGADAAPSQCSC
jgi:hypothetical protein